MRRPSRHRGQVHALHFTTTARRAGPGGSARTEPAATARTYVQTRPRGPGQSKLISVAPRRGLLVVLGTVMSGGIYFVVPCSLHVTVTSARARPNRCDAIGDEDKRLVFRVLTPSRGCSCTSGGQNGARRGPGSVNGWDGMREIWLVRPLVGATGRAAGDWFAAAWSGGVLLQPPPPPLGQIGRAFQPASQDAEHARCAMRDARCIRRFRCGAVRA